MTRISLAPSTHNFPVNSARADQSRVKVLNSVRAHNNLGGGGGSKRGKYVFETKKAQNQLHEDYQKKKAQASRIPSLQRAR